MFSKEELESLLKDTTDENIAAKLKAMLYADDDIVNAIKAEFKDDSLIKIEKFTNNNEYVVHFLCKDDDDNRVKRIKQAVDISMQFKDRFYPEIHVYEHIGIENIWWHNDAIQIYTREDVEQYWKENQ